MDKVARIIRAERSADNPYFITRRAAAQDERLTFEARGMLWYLLSKPDDWRVRAADLQQQCGKDRVYRILNELIDAGYIERRVARDERGRAAGTEYVIHETPLPDFPDAVNADTYRIESNTEYMYSPSESSAAVGNSDAAHDSQPPQEEPGEEASSPSPKRRRRSSGLRDANGELFSAVRDHLYPHRRASSNTLVAMFMHGNKKRGQIGVIELEAQLRGIDVDDVDRRALALDVPVFAARLRRLYPGLTFTDPQKLVGHWEEWRREVRDSALPWYGGEPINMHLPEVREEVERSRQRLREYEATLMGDAPDDEGEDEDVGPMEAWDAPDDEDDEPRPWEALGITEDEFYARQYDMGMDWEGW